MSPEETKIAAIQDAAALTPEVVANVSTEHASLATRIADLSAALEGERNSHAETKALSVALKNAHDETISELTTLNSQYDSLNLKVERVRLKLRTQGLEYLLNHA